MMIRLVILMSLLLSAITPAAAYSAPAKFDPQDGYHQYINWSYYARKEAGRRYPEASVVDFLYVGCKATSYSGKDIVYKYWMRSREREFGVYVTLYVDQRNNTAL